MSESPLYFETVSKPLEKLLQSVHKGEVVLPNIQRSWLWDGGKIKDLLGSIICGCPIGSFISLDYKGPFKNMAKQYVNGSPLYDPNGSPSYGSKEADPKIHLIDGQQRVTALYQSLWYREKEGSPESKPVKILATEGSEKERFYYIDMEAALECLNKQEHGLESGSGREDLESVVKEKPPREVYGPERKKELMEGFLFPTNYIFGSYAEDSQQGSGEVLNNWQKKFIDFHRGTKNEEGAKKVWKDFNDRVLRRFKCFEITKIHMRKDVSRRVMLRTFEKTNRNTEDLSTFDLMVGLFSMDSSNFDLRKDWKKKEKDLAKKNDLPSPSKKNGLMFLKALCLLVVLKRPGESGGGFEESDVIDLKHKDYRESGEDLKDGFARAADFFKSEMNIVFENRDLSYPPQLIVWAAIMAIIGDKWKEDERVKKKLRRWYICTSMTRYYGKAQQTKLLTDAKRLKKWLGLPGEETSDAKTRPEVVVKYEDKEEDFLREAKAAVLASNGKSDVIVKSVLAMIRKRGAKDFKDGSLETEAFERAKVTGPRRGTVDVHHIFPKKFCEDNDVSNDVEIDSIGNLTPMKKTTNEEIKSESPFKYIKKYVGAQNREATLEKHCIGRKAWDEIEKLGENPPSQKVKECFQNFLEARKEDIWKMVKEELKSTDYDEIP